MPSPLLVAHGLYENSGGVRFTRKTSAVTLKNNDAIIADTSGGSFVVTLPAVVSVGTQVFINDGDDWAINNLTIDPNGATIENFAAGENLTFNIGGLSVHLLYDGTKWNVHAQAGVYTGTPSNRITGLFSGSSHSARTLFQTNVLNDPSTIGVIPNGTGTISQVNLYNSSDPDNASILMSSAQSTEVSFRAHKLGTGTYLPMTFWVNNAERLRIDTSGNVNIGTYAALDPTTGRSYLSVRGTGTGPSDGSGNLQFQTNSTGAAGVNLGNIEWTLSDQTGSKRTAYISVSAVGSTVGNYGSELYFATKKDGEASGGLARLIITQDGHTIPASTNAYDLGSTTNRWRNIYTQDLHLSNGIGDYTMIEGEENLYLVNNKNGKHFKFALIEVDASEVPAKSEAADGA